MSIREKFLNITLTFHESLSEEQKFELGEKIQTVRDILHGKSKKITIESSDINNICRWFSIDQNSIEGRDLIKEIIQKTDYKNESSFPVVFIYNLLYINPIIVEKFLNSQLEENIARELIQLLTLIKLDKQKSIKEIAKSENLYLDTVYDLSSLYKYEKQIEDKTRGLYGFKQLAEFLNPLENDISLTEDGKKIYEKVVMEISQLLFKEPENENLIEFTKNKVCFNEYSLSEYEKTELNEIRKRELIQAIYMIELNPKDINEYSGNLFNQKERIINALSQRVSEEELLSAIEALPNERQTLSENKVDNISNMLRVEDYSKFLLFEQGSFNENNFKDLLLPEYKADQIILYFIILCCKENHKISCKLINNENIFFNQFEKYFYIEDILHKKLSEYTLNEILDTLHEFKKEKIFTKEDNISINSIISDKLVQKYSFNTKNKEVLFINAERCVFNEKLMNQIIEMTDIQLLELYIMTNENLREELSQNIIIDKKLINIEKYKHTLKDKIKYKITEKEIQDCLNSIEEKSNTLIESKNKIFQETSIEINAKEVKEISNDIVEFSYRNQELYLYIFNENICEKLLKKELVDLSKREFAQALLLSEIRQKNIVLKNPNGNEIKIHDNFNLVEKYHDMIVDKINCQISEEEIDKALKIITDKFENSIKENLFFSINNIKKKCGIKIKSTFKHIL